MKRKVWITLLLVLTAALGLVAFTSCKKDDPVNVTDIEGAESGTYYFDVSSEEEYDLSLSNGNKFTLLMRDVTRAGEYTLDGEKLTLNFSEPYTQTVEATYRNGEITLTYNNLTMRFIKKIYFTVSFDAHGGSSVSSVSVVNGRTIGKVTDPEREGYTFLGWYTDEAYSTSFAFDSQPVTGDITLHARWQAAASGAGFKVSFDLNYDNAPTLDPVTTVGGKILDLQDPRREGFLFAGWYVSQYGNKDQLSYAVDSNTVIKENVTLYATWEAPGNGSKLQMPRVSVTEQGLSWNASGANSYAVTVKGPAGFVDVNETTTSTSFPIEFATAPAGEYTITVQGTASNTANNSNLVTLHYKNKALARVSLFEVVSPATLLFNAVDHAREYLISIDCGNKKHVHTAVSNGNSTYYNFANCSMQKGGIKFRVTARANGYVESVSEEFVYERNLDAVTNVRVDDNQILAWDAVQGATNYILSIECTNGAHEHSRVDVGNATTYSLKECGKGEVKVTITATTKGYNAADPVEFTYNKATIASPSHFLLKGTILSWDAVDGASTYTLRIAGKTYSADTNSYDLATIKDIDWSTEVDYQATVQALTGNDPSSNSLLSDGVDMRYYALYSSLEYNRSILSWRHVIGVTRYEVSLNGASLGIVDNGENFFKVKFIKAGENTLSVRFFDDEQNIEGSEWVSIDVFTYTIEFDTRGGEAVDPMYVAYGDKLELPTTTRPGYEFDAWYNVPGGAEKNGAKFDSEYYLEATDIRLYASYDSKEYTVKYVYGDNRDEDQSVVHEGKVLYGKKYTLAVPAAPDSTVVFLGWFSREDGRGTRYTDEKGNSYNTWAIAENDTPVYAYFAKILSYTLVNNEYYSVSAGPGLVLVDSVEIPATYENYPVKAIPGFAFLNATTLKSIRIPDCIKILNLDAFKGCTKLEQFEIYAVGTADADIMFRSNSGVISIKENNTWTLYLYPVARSGDFVIPDDITAIAPGFFSGSRITKLTVPAGVNDVSLETFKDCLYLREVVFEDSSEEGAELSIYTGAFTNCPALRTVTFPKQLAMYGANPNDQTGINNGKAGVFVNCNRLENVLMSGAGYHDFSVVDGMLVFEHNLIFIPATKAAQNFTVPAGVTGIGDYLFERATYPYFVEIPAWVTYIGKDAFHGNTGLETVTFKASSSGLAAPLTIGEEAFWNCQYLTEVTFEDGCGVQKLEKRAFYMCDGLTALKLPKSLQEVGDYAFESCNSLASVEFVDGSEKLEIGMGIFSDCTSLSKIKLPSSISKIEYGSFEGANTDEIEIAPGGTHYVSDQNVVYGLREGTQEKIDLVYFPKNKDIKDIQLPDTLQKIGSFVFRGNTKLTEIKIPKSVTWIGQEAFKNATSLKSITFEGKDEVENFEFGADETSGKSEAFYNCISLDKLELPASLKVIPGGFLYMERKSASALREFTIPESVTEIGDQAFYQSNIQALNITAKVEKIGNQAFYNSNITSLTFDGESSNAPGSEGFVPVGDDGEVGGLQSIGDEAFYAAKITSLDLPDSVTTIGSRTFRETRIVRLTLGKGIKTVGSNAFQGCTALVNVTIGSDISQMGSGVFEGCYGLTSMSFANGVKIIPSNILSNTSVSSVSIANTVTEIADYSLNSSNLTSVSFVNGGAESNLTKIGDSAFSSSNIQSITVPNKVTTIGSSAFSSCSQLSTVTLPLSLTSIGSSAFSSCAQLTTVNFNANGSTEAQSLTIGDYAFQGCTRLTAITLPKTVSELGNNIFSESGMTNLSIDNSNEHIQASDGVIYDKGRTTIISVLPTKSGEFEVPNTVNYINDLAFSGTQITKVTFQSGNNKETLRIGSKATIEDSDGTFKGDGWEGAFQFSQNGGGYDSPRPVAVLASVTLPSDREVWIGGSAFSGCSALTSITLGKTKHIGNSAFQSSGLTSITLPEDLTDIGDYAFSSCSGLTGEFKLPANVAKLGSGVFSSTPLTEFEFESNSKLKEIDGAFSSAFSTKMEGEGEAAKSVPTMKSLAIPDSVTSIKNSAFSFANIGEITIGKGVEEIGQSAFYYCYATKIKFATGATLKTIGSNAFQYMQNLTSVENLPASVKQIGNSAFESCSKLETFTFEEKTGAEALVIGEPNGGSNVFASCTSLKEIKLPTRVSTICANAFNGCTSLKSVELPNALTSIPNGIFRDCSALETVTMPSAAQITSIGSYAFYGCSKVKSFTLPATVTEIGEQAFYNFGADNLNFTIGVDSASTKSQLKKIGKEAFRGSNITAFDFSKTAVDTLGTAVFRDCKRLASVTFGGNITTIPLQTFMNCENLEIKDWSHVITAIENAAFYNCKKITKFEAWAELISLGTFNSSLYSWYYGPGLDNPLGVFDQAGITEVDFSKANNLQVIGSGAFNGTKLTGKVEIPDKVITLSPFAFGDTAVTELSIPSTLTPTQYTSGYNTYYAYLTNNILNIPTLEKITVKENAGSGSYCSTDGVLYYKSSGGDNKILMAWPVAKTADFSESNIQKYFTDENVSRVYNYAFYQNKGFEGKDIDLTESGVTRFGEYAIAETGVKTLKLPGATLDNNALVNNEKLEKLEFADGDGTETFGTKLFQMGGESEGCPKLTSITLPKDLKAIPASFLLNTAVTSIEVPASVTSISDSAFAIPSLTSVTFADRDDNSQLVLGNGVFQNSSITTIELPENTTFLVTSTSYGTTTYNGNKMFSGCTQLTKVVLPDSIPYLRGSFFKDCTSLKVIEGLEDLHLEWIDYNVFENCTSLTTGKEVAEGETDDGYMTLNVERLEDYSAETGGTQSMLAGSGIKKLKFGATLSYVSSYAFAKANQLEEIDMSAATEVAIKYNIVDGDKNLKTVKLPQGDVDWRNEGYAAGTYFPVFGSAKNLETIEIGENVTTLPGSFTAAEGTPNLKSVDVPTGKISKIHTIGPNALQGLKGEVEKYELPVSVETISEGAFNGSNIKEFTFKEGGNLRDIGKNAFSNMPIHSISIPESVSALGEGVFQGCTALEKVEGCSKVDSIPAYLFSGCEALQHVPQDYIKKATSVGMNAFDGCLKLADELDFEAADTVSNYAFQNCEALTTVKLPKATSIPNSCFAGCKALTSVTFSEDVTSIGDNAFEGCVALENIEIGNVQTIGRSAFKNCAKLDEITFKSVNSVGESAFEGCTELSKVTIEDDCRLDSIGKRAFFGCEKLSEIHLNNNLASIDDEAFANCKALTELTIPGSVTAIGDGAFRGVKGLKCEDNSTFKVENSALYDKDGKELISYHGNGEYKMPENVESIRPYAFAGSKVSKIEFNSTIKTLGSYAFAGAESLTQIKVPSTVTALAEYVFADSSLQKVEFTSTAITKLPDHAFDGSKISEFKIPDSVTELGEGVFMNCVNLTKIDGGKNVKMLNNDLFNGCEKLKTIADDLWKDITNIGANTFRGCKELGNNEFTGHFENVKPIIPDQYGGAYGTAEGIFAGTGITDLSWIPTSWTTFGKYWFEGCTELTSVTIPSQISTLGEDMFVGVPLTEFEVTEDNSNEYLVAYASRLFAGLAANEDNELTLKITLPENMTMLNGSELFAEITAKKFTVELNGITSLGGSNLFSGAVCEEIVIHGSALTELGSNAFNQYGEEGAPFKKIDLPKTITSFGSYMFGGCSKLEDILVDGQSSVTEENGKKVFTIPSNITSIGSFAFSGANVADSMVIPDSVTKIDDNGLYGYGSKLATPPTIKIEGETTRFNAKVWNNCTTATVVDSEGKPLN